MDTVEPILEAWHTNNRINLFLIERISEEGLRCTLSTRGGRDVARQFCHMHNIRLWQLNQRRAKDLARVWPGNAHVGTFSWKQVCGSLPSIQPGGTYDAVAPRLGLRTRPLGRPFRRGRAVVLAS